MKVYIEQFVLYALRSSLLLSHPLVYGLYMKKIEVSDCDILRNHDSRIMTYHDYENYHDCHILQTFGTNKQVVVYKNHVTVLF